MERIWFVAYLALALLAIVQLVLTTLQTWEHRRFARNRMRELRQRRARGRVAVFAPCKGVDPGMEDNLRCLLEQDHDDYEVTFVVESAEDPACELVRRLMAEYRHIATRLVIAGRASTSGQKVHNLCVATARISPSVQYLAFVDSDARPRRQWLGSLIARLDRPRVGAATGYRWLVPTRPSLANHLLYSINCGVALLLGRGRRNLVWGGSWAIRRELFESLGVRKAWDGKVSDDLAVSRVLRRHRLGVIFEPPCMVASPLDCSLGQMFGFVRRQYFLSRFCIPAWWALALATSTVTNLAWLSSVILAAWAILYQTVPVWIPGGVCAVLYGAGVLRGWLRQDMVRIYFPSLQHALRKARQFDIWAAPIAGLVNWAGLLGSMFGRRMVWRGIHYRLRTGGRTERVRHADPPQPYFLPMANSGRESQAPDEELLRWRKAG